ncbi:hypothetical protein MJO28_009805 [Puccinia striiformis f. sp. tritici]|uniref:Uncharacterized protein n=1 Tax=Puccinia striiformis f. sp. tritici TaxID=168172 RepID=A0ACC0E9F2_9BASI|nr:hypothetical protein MJO28_009805 [Puccinia striiformis f. sp. tritici]
MAQINPNLAMFSKITTKVQPLPSKPPNRPRKTTTKKQIEANDKNDNQADAENKGRSRNYMEKEDVQLCVSWVETSQDPKKGTDQTLNSFWDALANHYTTHLLGSRQTVKSLQGPWGDHIQISVNKFMGCVHQVDRLNPSGKTDSNRFQLAMTTFSGLYNKPFAFLSCPEILVESPKWNKYCCTLEKKKERSKSNSKRENSTSETQLLDIMSTTDAADSQAPCPSDIEGSRDDNSSFPTRAIGRKRAKADKAAALIAQRNSDNIKNMAQAHSDIAAATKHQTTLLELQQKATLHLADEAIMCRDTSQMSGPMKMYYESEQAKILARIAQEDAAAANRSTLDNTNSPDISAES